VRSNLTGCIAAKLGRPLPAVSTQRTLTDTGIASLDLNSTKFQILDQPGQRLRHEFLVLRSRRASVIKSTRTGYAGIAEPDSDSDSINAEFCRIAIGVDGVEFGMRL